MVDTKNMTLIAGATGTTGSLLVSQLLERGLQVKAIIRPQAKLPASINAHPNLSIIRANILDLSDADLMQHVDGCGAIASCLGHTMSLKGMFGQPRRLVTDATRRLCEAVARNAPAAPVRFVLMNTTGNRNPDVDDALARKEKIVMQLVRTLLPPHSDNEQAAEFLRTSIGPDHKYIEWVVVRPDSLLNHDAVTPYKTYPSPIRSAIFNPGSTSRINVAHFMAELMTDGPLWENWKGRMPVIYNEAG